MERVSKKVRQLEVDPPDVGGDEEMVEEGRATPFSFRDVLNSRSSLPSREDEWN